jgi:TPR repeat protein
VIKLKRFALLLLLGQPARLVAAPANDVHAAAADVAPSANGDSHTSGSLEEADAAYGKRDFTTALKLYQNFASQGNSLAQLRMGTINRIQGEDVLLQLIKHIPDTPYKKSKDVELQAKTFFVEALKWYRVAAAQGSAEAQNEIGQIYELGRGGVDQSKDEALKWYLLAAAQGYAPAQNNVGLIYLGQAAREAPSQKEPQYLQWFRLAADQGFAEAQLRIGYMYKEGLGVTRDYAEAIKWYRLAAGQKYPYAGLNLAILYTKIPDVVRAYVWYSISVENGYGFLVRERDDVAARLNPSQLNEAKIMIKKYQESNEVP